MFTRRQRACATSAIAVLLTMGIAACGTAKAPGPGGAPSSPLPPAATGGSTGTQPPQATASPVPSVQPLPSAASQLAGFFSAAAVADNRLKDASALVNEGVGRTSMQFSPAALAAVKALSTDAVAHAIPAGLPPELLRRVLLAYSDLESRTVALSRVADAQYYQSPLPINSSEGGHIHGCLGNGAPAAARYDADMAAVHALAVMTAPVAIPAPDSRSAAELALRIAQINRWNSGCAGCGGYVSATLSQVVWQPKNVPVVGRSDGTISGVPFHVEYHAGSGWTATIWVC